MCLSTFCSGESCKFKISPVLRKGVDAGFKVPTYHHHIDLNTFSDTGVSRCKDAALSHTHTCQASFDLALPVALAATVFSPHCSNDRLYLEK